MSNEIIVNVLPNHDDGNHVLIIMIGVDIGTDE
jgi:hypothetical protein